MAKPAKHDDQAATKFKSWAERRKGFKHELILTLSVLGFSFRRAEDIVEATLDAIVEAMQRKEEVTVEGFGVWRVCTTSRRRGWRFGKIVIFKPYKVAFEPDNTAIFSARDPNWTGHAAWQNSRQKPRKLSKREALEQERIEAEQRQAIREQCVRTITKFVESYVEDWGQFWTLRWYSQHFQSAAAQAPAPDEFQSIQGAAQAIEATRPRAISRNHINRLIDCVCWYARWSRRIMVDAKLWTEAEREAADWLLRRR